MQPHQGSDPATGHPGLGRGAPPPVWGVHLEALGQLRGQLPSSMWTQHGAVKQGHSGAPLGQPPKGKEG